MKKFGKITALVLAVIMCVSVFAACKNEKKPIADNYRLSQKSMTLNLSDEKIGSLTIVDDSYSDKSYTQSWKTADPSVATVSNGVVTATGVGETVITVTLTVEGYDPFDLTCKVTVENTEIAVERITLTKKETSLEAGATEVIQAIVSPSNATNKTVIWESSDPNVATVIAGQITAVANGTAIITARTPDGTVSAQCVVTVEKLEDEISSLKLNYTSKTIYVGKTYTLKGTVKPDGASYTIIWTSSDEDVAVVNSNGVVTAISKGTATITATIKDNVTDKTATCKITVKEEEQATEPPTVKVTDISLDKTSLTLAIKESYTVKATLKPSNATEKASWKSSNTKVATVDSNGKITAVAAGSATITCTAGSKSAIVVVTVTSGSVPSTGITLDKSKVVITVNSTATIKATLTPADSTDTITWTTNNPDVAAVSATGIVTGKAKGTAIITATTESGKIAMCVVEVTEEKKATVKLDKTALELVIGDTVTLNKTVDPADAESGLVWKYSSSNPNVAVVAASSGAVTALSEGTATITLVGANTETNEVVCSATCTVTVLKTAKQKDVKVTISLSNTSSRLDYYKDANLTATLKFYPTLTEEEINKLTFEIVSSNEDVIYASYPRKGDYTFDLYIVSEIGSATITPKITGLDNINFTYESKAINVLTADSSITRPATSITIVPSSMTINVGEVKYLGFKALPENNNDEFIFSTSNANIVTVSPTGKIEAVGAGTATIKVIAVGNSSARTVEASCTIRVNDPVKVENGRISIPVGGSYNIVFDKNLGTFKDWNLASSDGYISLNKSTGRITVSSEAVAGSSMAYLTITYLDKNNLPQSYTNTIVVTRATSSQVPPTRVQDLVLYVGDKGTIEGAFGYQFDSIVDYKSSRPEVLTVTLDGRFEAITKGAASVTVSYDGSEYLRLSITVKEKSTTYPTKSMTMDISEGAIYLSSKVVLDLPIENREFQTSNANVVKVTATGMDCQITPVAEGTAVITVKSGTATQKINVTVTKSSVVATAFTVSAANNGVIPTNGSCEITVNKTSGNAGSATITLSNTEFTADITNYGVSAGTDSFVITVSAKPDATATSVRATITINGVSKQITLTYTPAAQ